MFPLKPPSRKKKKNQIKPFNFPFLHDDNKLLDEDSWPKCQGILEEKQGVIVSDLHQKIRLSEMGCFGKSVVLEDNKFVDYKTFHNQIVYHKKDWNDMKIVPFELPEKSSSSNNSTNKVVEENHKSGKSEESKIKNDDVCTPTNWKDLKTNFTKQFRDLLMLSGNGPFHDIPYLLFFEEAFFLMYTFECLEIKEKDGSIISAFDCWKKFNSFKENFSHFYAAYHYYRSKGWTVKLDRQYGGHFVLYKLSPVYFHSSYVVVINVNGQNSDLLPSWQSWSSCYRAIESTGKDLLLCTVHGPTFEEGMFIDLTQYSVNDTIVRRWVPSKNRHMKRNAND